MSSPAITGPLPLLPLRGAIILPGAAQPVDLGRSSPAMQAVRAAQDRARGGAGRVIAVLLRDTSAATPDLDQLYPVAIACEVVQVLAGTPGRTSVTLRGLSRVRLHDIYPERDYQIAEFDAAAEIVHEPTLAYALAGALQDLVKQHDGLQPTAAKSKARAQAQATILAERSPSLIADLSAAHVELDGDERLAIQQEVDVVARLRKVIELISHRTNVLQVKRDLDRYVREHLSKHEHDALLRHKLKAIQHELGESEGEAEERALQDLERRLQAAELPTDVRAAADRELGRLRRMNPQSSEATTCRTWLEWIADLPWSPATLTEDKLDMGAARNLLEDKHYGLQKVKKRVLEYLCVRKLAPDKRGPILCLVGPPGVGKTSLGRSIADALGRRYVRISLGGIRDDAEIRGHRRTYIGALPGRFIQAMKRAGSKNPVIVLDEIDKLVGANLRGDPASALLEALDPEQNTAFHDHYLGVDYDLSKVIFLCTANDLGTIPGVLRDRLEIIQLTGYTIEEKLEIARRHLLPKQRQENGLAKVAVEVPEDVLLTLATQYTRESGVRNLERELASLLRDVAMQIAEGKQPSLVVGADEALRILGPPRYYDELAAKEPSPGLVTGLGWTPTGGTILFVEATLTRGTGHLRLTGKLGEVMKESAQAALSLVRSRGAELGADAAVVRDLMKHYDVHIHFPAGAVPKDGPSAGIAISTALVSLFSRRPARVDVAMTGEITLRGQVLPVGGIREKVLAAHRAGIRDVILPDRNRKDEPEIPEAARADMRLHYVKHIREVLEAVLLPTEDAEAAAE
ncbi:endopeptidase La [Nannocystis pusilla]|uniref:endopeptidase La n=1 Tax=Nannocystis pusilla TaxID=889268 RepID=UPI003DA37AEA